MRVEGIALEELRNISVIFRDYPLSNPMGLRLSFLLVAAQAFTGPAGAVSLSQEDRASARIAAEAGEFLDQLVGPGLSKVLAEVEGEVSVVQTQREVNAPIVKAKQPNDEGSLPGYLKTQEVVVVEVGSYQKDTEILKNTTGFRIRKMTVAVVLDRSVPKRKENTIRRIFPILLRMDKDRGDKMTIVRANLIPPWKSAWMSAAGLRMLSLFGGISAIVLFVCLWFYFTAMSAVRAFTSELAARRGAGPLAPQQVAAPLPPPGPEGALDLGSGDLPSLTGEDESDAYSPGELAAIGTRFDFLANRNPADVAELLSAESAEDLALLFAYISDTEPDRSSRLFSHLSPELQAEISGSLVRLTMADPEKLSVLESRIKTNVEFGLRGSDRLGRILSRMPLDEREGLLGELMSRDPEGAEAVERAVFPFEAILDLKTTDLRRLIMAITYSDWGLALRGASDSVVECVLNELPAGTRNIVRETIDTQQTREKVFEARSKVLQQVYALAAKGLIEITSEGSESEMI